MTKSQLEILQKKLGSTQTAVLMTMESHQDLQYLFIYWQINGKTLHLDCIFVIYKNDVLRRIEVDGFINCFILSALDQALKN